MKNNNRITILIIISIVTLCACGPNPAFAPTPTLTNASYPINTRSPIQNPTSTITPQPTWTSEPTPVLFPLSIEAMRSRDFPGSQILIEKNLPPGTNYNRYICSYFSEGLKIYALLTVPEGEKPRTGWPVIIFNHGYIPPTQYHTTERYVDYVERLAREGYIVFRSDYRGHDQSEGEARGAYGYPDYVVDVLNGLQSIKSFPGADPDRIGMWGHSMGGYITLRSMVIRSDIKAGVIWAGVVGSYPDLLIEWPQITPPLYQYDPSWRTGFITEFGTPEENPDFWSSISATNYLRDISGPLQLHHSIADDVVPFEFSNKLYHELLIAEKKTEFYAYQGDNHNIAINFNLAMDRTVEWFDRYVKGD
ncbi:MAG: alpha/beta fold hydrolase [Chloroflexota bacterium]